MMFAVFGNMVWGIIIINLQVYSFHLKATGAANTKQWGIA